MLVFMQQGEVVSIMGSWWKKKKNLNLRDELQLEYQYNDLKELRGLIM